MAIPAGMSTSARRSAKTPTKDGCQESLNQHGMRLVERRFGREGALSALLGQLRVGAPSQSFRFSTPRPRPCQPIQTPGCQRRCCKLRAALQEKQIQGPGQCPHPLPSTISLNSRPAGLGIHMPCPHQSPPQLPSSHKPPAQTGEQGHKQGLLSRETSNWSDRKEKKKNPTNFAAAVRPKARQTQTNHRLTWAPLILATLACGAGHSSFRMLKLAD